MTTPEKEAKALFNALTAKDVCKHCGCTDEDCSQCIEAQGYPCYWVVRAGKESVCSRCDAERRLKGNK